jgi:hypothetical protein
MAGTLTSTLAAWEGPAPAKAERAERIFHARLQRGHFRSGRRLFLTAAEQGLHESRK